MTYIHLYLCLTIRYVQTCVDILTFPKKHTYIHPYTYEKKDRAAKGSYQGRMAVFLRRGNRVDIILTIGGNRKLTGRANGRRGAKEVIRCRESRGGRNKSEGVEELSLCPVRDLEWVEALECIQRQL